MSRIPTKPSPAMVIAVIALSFAIAGTAVAGTDALKRAVTKSKVRQIAKKQANKVLNSRAGEFLAADSVAAYGNADSADVDDFTTTTYTDVLSRTFTAPSAGVAMITATVGAADDLSLAGFGALYTRVTIDGTATTDDNFNSPAFYIAPQDGGTGTNTVVVPVAAGDHTAAIQARAGGTGAYIFSRQISVMVVPNGDPTTIPYRAGEGAGGVGDQGQP